jgi:hypothetical protein
VKSVYERRGIAGPERLIGLKEMDLEYSKMKTMSRSPI